MTELEDLRTRGLRAIDSEHSLSSNVSITFEQFGLAPREHTPGIKKKKKKKKQGGFWLWDGYKRIFFSFCF